MHTPMDERLSLIGQDAEFQRLLHAAQMVAVTDTPVLLTGESGSGRGRMALEIHHRSRLAREAFQVHDCSLQASLPDQSELKSGSWFLRRVEALNPVQQNQLLLQMDALAVKGVRLLASADASLMDLVEAGEFRSDLYFRLNVVPLEVPSLRTRGGDVPLLLRAFLRDFSAQYGRKVPQLGTAANNLVKSYDWPGNVRELRNLAERLVILLPGKTIQPENLPLEIRQRERAVAGFRMPAQGLDLNALEADLLSQALTLAGGNRSKAARLLKISRDTFLYRLQKFAIDD